MSCYLLAGSLVAASLAALAIVYFVRRSFRPGIDHELKTLMKAGQYAKAAEAGNKLLAENPENAALLSSMGDINMALGDTAAAEKYLLKCTELNPWDSYAARLLGDLYLNRGEIEKAVVYYNKTIELRDPMNGIWAQAGLSRAYGLSGKQEESKLALSKALELAVSDDAKREVKRRAENP